MSEAASGSALLAGNPGSNSATGDNGGANAAQNNANGGSTSVEGSLNAGSNNAANGNWWDAIEDGDLKGYVQNKAWKDPVELANGYRNLEKLLGSEKLPMPKGDNDNEGWARVYDALGRPKSADDYKLPVPEGMPDDFSKAAASKFHELGISTKQASALAEWWNQTSGATREQMMQQSAQASERDLNSLRQEWGQAWDENVELGRRAAREFGIAPDMLNKMESAMGTKNLLELMSKIGRGFTEHEFEGGKSINSFGMTPEAAKQRISDLRGDKEWSAKYLQGNADAKAEMARLMALAFPEG
jgi:hypothetical protein